MNCSIEGCDLRHRAKGMCKLHYNRAARGTLGKTTRYPNGRTANGSRGREPYEFRKVDGVWFRSPVDVNRFTKVVYA